MFVTGSNHRTVTCVVTDGTTPTDNCSLTGTCCVPVAARNGDAQTPR